MIDDPNDPLERLRAGNARFLNNETASGRFDSARIWALASKQEPFACVLACSDSRVPVEFVFDQGLGDLFVVRTAGNTAGDHEVSSVSFAVSVLEVPLVVVLGHTGCGVVRAALEGGASDPKFGPEITSLLGEVTVAHPVARRVGGQAHPVTDEEVDRVGREHVLDVARTLVEVSPSISAGMRNGRCRVVAAMYETGTGRVAFIDEVG